MLEQSQAEEFLRKAADIMRHDLFEPLGLKVPHVPITIGTRGDWETGVTSYYFDRTLTRRPERIGISNELPSAMEAAATLAHEMTHAALPFEAAHGPQFEAIVRKLGLSGPATSTWAGPKFAEYYDKHLKALEPRPVTF